MRPKIERKFTNQLFSPCAYLLLHPDCFFLGKALENGGQKV